MDGDLDPTFHHTLDDNRDFDTLLDDALDVFDDLNWDLDSFLDDAIHRHLDALLYFPVNRYFDPFFNFMHDVYFFRENLSADEQSDNQDTCEG